MKVALVYDRVNKWGGAERVLLALHDLFPDAPLYTSVYDQKRTPWAKVFNVKTSFLQKFPFAKSLHELYAVLMPLAFESFSFDEYDLVISLTSEAAKGIITKPKTLHICYCLTPTRYLWSGYDEYFKNSFFRFIAKPVISYLRFWDKIAAQRPDAIIAISKEVQERIKKFYNRDSLIIYPPLTLSAEVAPSRRNSSRYFLIVSRLVSYKRIDVAIRAFNRLKLSLKIVGTGLEEVKLRSLAGPNIEFLGHLTDKELIEYYKGCRALIFPGREDFGLTILEAQSLGKPVIAYRRGGALETVFEGKTGMFFYPQTSEALTKVLKEFMNLKFDPKDCIAQAKKFSFENFKKNFTSEIKRLSRI
ncbi:MAG: glycosyltransferase [Patescibacteria group bacterium]|nr:glycosyltransferase [Patescibacteria group bacterium]